MNLEQISKLESKYLLSTYERYPVLLRQGRGVYVTGQQRWLRSCGVRELAGRAGTGTVGLAGPGNPVQVGGATRSGWAAAPEASTTRLLACPPVRPWWRSQAVRALR